MTTAPYTPPPSLVIVARGYLLVTEDGIGWPVGSLVPAAVATPPLTLPADGSAYRKEEFPELYAALCFRPWRSWWQRIIRRPPAPVCAWGEDGEWFNVPDLRGRVKIGST